MNIKLSSCIDCVVNLCKVTQFFLWRETVVLQRDNLKISDLQKRLIQGRLPDAIDRLSEISILNLFEKYIR